MSVFPSPKVDSVKAIRVDVSRKGEGPTIKDLYNPDSHKTGNFLVSIGVFKPGEGLLNHIHPDADEVYFVYKGRGVVDYGKEGKSVPVEADMGVYIPKGVKHGVENTGKEDLKIAFFVVGKNEHPTPLMTKERPLSTGF